MNGKNILQTLVELLEAQEEIKITYTIKEREETDGTKRNIRVTQEMA